MNNTEIKQAIEAGNQATIAEAFKFEQLKELIRKLIGEAGKKVDIDIKAVLLCGNPFPSIETGDLHDCWGTCARQVWKHIYLDSNSYFIEKGNDPNKASAKAELLWRYQKHDGERNWMPFAEFFFDFGSHPGEWQAWTASGEVVTLN